jgi:flagella basal body P-ring formation protein FlgA
VVCLESGRAGQVVRVRVAESRRVKLAEITESGELRLRISR